MAQVIETVFSIRTEESIANLNDVVGALGRTEQAAKKTHPLGNLTLLAL